MKESRDTVYYWLQEATDAKEILDDFDRCGFDPTAAIYQQYQRKYDEAMAQVQWMKRLAPFEREVSED